jgi:hypothetical protein
MILLLQTVMIHATELGRKAITVLSRVKKQLRLLKDKHRGIDKK